MKLLILGFSSVVQRRVLPAATSLQRFESIEIASRRPSLGTYSDYQEALQKSPADLVYVSTVNSDHVIWVDAALRAGKHVIVDKPAFTDVRDAERLVDLAKKKKLLLAEALVYQQHPQIQFCREQFDQKGEKPKTILINFSFPPLDPGNFRYKKDLGGGALLDLGPYAVSVGRLFFGDYPKRVTVSITGMSEIKGQTPVETAFSLLCDYPDGATLVGHFGFDTEYCHQITFLSASCAVSFPRIFTTPVGESNTLQIRRANQSESIKGPVGDAFALFLDDVSKAVQSGAIDTLSNQLLCDSWGLSTLRLATNLPT